MKVFAAVISALLVIALLYFGLTPSGRAAWNNYFHDVQKADDNTRYENRKHVEDTCRSMIASYESDRLVYEQYKDSDNEEKQSWAEQAKMRANKTATEYNNYILKNSYIWDDNVPADINRSLAIIY